ncbi:MAG: gamma-glutamyltransferase family protein [Chloroflexota bacterium]|jgi:gamma-glutamyltranspeptidase/glutathione hydrolase|nr:gamma-glutamyltransferase family protein [Chloroflexota bacterium]
MPSTVAPNGMVVTPHPLATEAGVQALRAGGSAVDAAVAANAMLAVVYCNSCGLGGDAFALVWDPGEKRLHGYNGSGRSPAALSIDAVRAAGHAQMPQRGPLPITVPGAVDAWVELLGRFGRRSLGDALVPAAEVAERGYQLTAINVRSIATALPTFDDDARAVFGGAGKAGDTFRQPLLAASLRAIADGGRGAYYGGPIGDEIARAIGAAGGVMTGEDIAAHRGDWVEPIATRYRDVEVATIPPNSQGITALMALNVLSALDWPLGEPASANRLHAQIEAIKVAWSERDRCVADPDRGHADPSALLSEAHAAWLGSRVSPDRAHRFTPTNPPGGGTVYLCAADADGMLVSLIESNYMGFGSGIMGGSTGIMLQNRGAYFSLDPDHANALAPGSRTLHTLMPGMLLRDGVAEVALGAMGGDGQPQTMIQLVTGLVDDGLEPQALVDRPRWVVSTEAAGQPLGPVSLESDGWSEGDAHALRARGHEVALVEPKTPLMGWAQVIRRRADGSYEGGADPRADSLASGL